jgi:antitoxin component HigA of HigAB toxin-antitoxin module
MSEQTRIAVLAEYRAARAAEDYQRALDIVLVAIDHDDEHPTEPPLTAELRGLHLPAAA